MSGDEENERGFTIVDRRGDDEERDDTAEAPAASGSAASGHAGARTSGEAPAPPVDFTGFVLSLATSALYHLGLVADPETGQPGAVNRPIARQTIDTLAMLQDKTRGNLDDEEQALLTNLLTELRMRYVESGAS